MKYENILKFLFISLTCISVVACSDDDDSLLPDIASVSMEGEGGEAVIDLKNENFSIVGVINKTNDYNVYMFGDIYSPDGELVRENTRLELEGLGSMETGWNDQGFRIVRDRLSQLRVTVKENTRIEDFNFAIVVQAADEVKEILIMQKKSEGYVFDKIEYSIKADDGDSLYVRRGTTFNFNLLTPQTMQFDPFSGIDIVKRQYFESGDVHAFAWTKDNPPAVVIPGDIWDNEIRYDTEKGVYTNHATEKPHNFQNMQADLSVPAGSSVFYTDIEFWKRTVSYELTLINNRTKEKRVVQGKWVENAPTGVYTIVRAE